MATAANKTRCTICGKERATFRCAGCLDEFCHKHLNDHRQELHKQLDEIEMHRDVFRESLNEQIKKPNNHVLMQQIDNWERASIKKIRQAAQEAREVALKNTDKNIYQLETKLNKLTDQLRESRDEDDFNEINLRHFQEQLKQLTDELTKPSNISIRNGSESFISKIFVDVSDNSIAPISVGEYVTLSYFITHTNIKSIKRYFS